MRDEKDREVQEQVTVTFTVPADAVQDREQLADLVAEALGPLAEKAVNVSDVAIRTIDRFGGAVAGGYESRLWEKATCKEAGDPRDVLVNPASDLERVVQELDSLRVQVDTLNTAVEKISRTLGQR